jgi:hypothetical protein
MEGDIGGIRAALAGKSNRDKIDTALAAAIINNQVLCVAYLLENGADPNSQDARLVFSAIRNKNLEILKILIHYGASVENDKAFMYSCVVGFCEGAKYFFNKSNLNKDQINRAVFSACHFGYEEVFDFLIDKCADIYDEKSINKAYDNKNINILRKLIFMENSPFVHDVMIIKKATRENRDDVLNLFKQKYGIEFEKIQDDILKYY